MRPFLKWTVLVLFIAFICSCASVQRPPVQLSPTPDLQASPSTISSTATPISIPLSTPIPNNFGLTIEENEILGQEQHEAVLQQHAQSKEEPYEYKLPYPTNGDNRFKAILDTKVSGEVEVVLQQDEITIFEFNGGDVSPIQPLRGLWVDQEHWILEIAFVTNTTDGNTVHSNAVGQIYRDGLFLNEQYGYEEMFGFQLLDGKPFYFYQKDSRIHLSFNDEDLPVTYDEVTHYQCCSAAERNPIAASNWVGFWGQRNGVWYYTEIGRY